MPPPSSPHLLRAPEMALALAALAMALLAALLPAVMLPAHYHDFADQRTLAGLPRAMDVLTNLPFALMGVLVLWRLSGLRNKLSKNEYLLSLLTALGLLATAACSAIYHLRPDAWGLALDRAGMGLAFAGVLGLAVATRVSARAGAASAVAVALWAALAAWCDAATANMTPWVVLQGGGLLLLAVLACRPPRAGALPLALWPVLGLYAIAKALELADAPVLAFTHGLISGHSAKHLVAALAALAALPVCTALGRRAQAPRAGTIRPLLSSEARA